MGESIVQAIFEISFGSWGICYFHDHDINPAEVSGSLYHFLYVSPCLNREPSEREFGGRSESNGDTEGQSFVKLLHCRRAGDLLICWLVSVLKPAYELHPVLCSNHDSECQDETCQNPFFSHRS